MIPLQMDQSALPVTVTATVIAISLPIPMVVVLEPPMLSIPVAGIKPLAIVPRSDPARVLVWRSGPVPVVPLVVVADRVPVPLDPHELRSGIWGWRVDHARLGRGTDSDPDRNLGVDARSD